MKTSHLLLAASLVTNAALALVVWRAVDPADAALASASASAPSTDVEKPRDGKSPASSAPRLSEREETAHAKALVAALRSRDAAGLRDRLRALGLPEETAASFARIFVWQAYTERQRQIAAKKNDPDRPFWKGNTATNSLTREERAELRQLSSSLRKELIAALGNDAFSNTQSIIDRYGFLGPDKAEQLLDLNRDYSEMRAEITQEASRFRVASDDEKTKYLEAERRKDLEVMFTPEELAEYDLRYSPTAAALRSRFAGIDATEQEYRAVYALMKSLDSAAPAVNSREIMQQQGGRPNQEQIQQMQTRRQLQEQAAEQLKTLLGPERFAAFQRANDADYRNLQAAADRFNLPATTVNQVYDLRAQAAAESQRIGDNAGLTPAQKKEALGALAENVRAQVRSRLGDDVGTAYLGRSMTWLTRVAEGNVLTLRDNGTSFRNVGPTPPARRTIPPSSGADPVVIPVAPATAPGAGG